MKEGNPAICNKMDETKDLGLNEIARQRKTNTV